MNEDGTYVESDDIMDMYDLEFISSNVNDSYDSYIKDSKYRTPYDDITEKIKNQVLIAENVIVGKIPNTYYNFEGMNTNSVIDVIE